MMFIARVKAEDTKKLPGSAMMETPVEGGKYRFAIDMMALLICKTDDSNKNEKTKQEGSKQVKKQTKNTFKKWLTLHFKYWQ